MGSSPTDNLLLEQQLAPVGLRRGDRRRQRRRLAERERLVSRLGELSDIDRLLTSAQDVVEHGWVQDVWFTYRTGTGTVVGSFAEAGPLSPGSPQDVGWVAGCLVSAVRRAGHTGGHSRQVVERSLDATWHALHSHGRADERVRWCPAPEIRDVHVHDLARWNDRHGRTADDVTALLGATRTVTAAERLHAVADLREVSARCVPGAAGAFALD